MKASHALTTNGRVHGELKDPMLSPEDVIGQRLTLLDGSARYSLNLWKLPNDVPFDRVDLKAWPKEYIQAAGSKDRMTLEVRLREEHEHLHYVLGREVGGGSEMHGEVVIPWDGYEAHVRPSEVFSAPEAAHLFVWYFQTGGLPVGVNLRPKSI